MFCAGMKRGRRCISFSASLNKLHQFIPAPTWSLAELLPCSSVSDSSTTSSTSTIKTPLNSPISSSPTTPTIDEAQIARLAKLSLLHIEPQSETSKMLQRDLASILAFTNLVRQYKPQQPPQQPPPQQQQHHISEEFESFASTRLAEYRKDVVTEGEVSAEQTLSQAVVKEGPYFSVPRVVTDS